MVMYYTKDKAITPQAKSAANSVQSRLAPAANAIEKAGSNNAQIVSLQEAARNSKQTKQMQTWKAMISNAPVQRREIDLSLLTVTMRDRVKSVGIELTGSFETRNYTQEELKKICSALTTYQMQYNFVSKIVQTIYQAIGQKEFKSDSAMAPVPLDQSKSGISSSGVPKGYVNASEEKKGENCETKIHLQLPTSAATSLPEQSAEERKDFLYSTANLPNENSVGTDHLKWKNKTLSEKPERILILANNKFDTPQKYNELETVKEIQSTDLSYPTEPAKRDKITTKKMDNSKDFPFPENYFDRIIMREAICSCPGAEAHGCAGIAGSAQEIFDFLIRIAKSLNKNNSNAKAFLHGVPAGTKNELWFTACERFLAATRDRWASLGVRAQIKYTLSESPVEMGKLAGITLSFVPHFRKRTIKPETKEAIRRMQRTKESLREAHGNDTDQSSIQ